MIKISYTNKTAENFPEATHYDEVAGRFRLTDASGKEVGLVPAANVRSIRKVDESDDGFNGSIGIA